MPIYAAIITQATSDVPAPPSDVKYAAITTDTDHMISVGDLVPTRMRGITEILNVVPAEVGDPCILMRLPNGWSLIVLTEGVEYAECEEQESAQAQQQSVDLRSFIRSEVLNAIGSMNQVDNAEF